MSKRISILGSTGSIGRQSLEVIASCGMEVAALTANASVERLDGYISRNSEDGAFTTEILLPQA